MLTSLGFFFQRSQLVYQAFGIKSVVCQEPNDRTSKGSENKNVYTVVTIDVALKPNTLLPNHDTSWQFL